MPGLMEQNTHVTPPIISAVERMTVMASRVVVRKEICAKVLPCVGWQSQTPVLVVIT